MNVVMTGLEAKRYWGDQSYWSKDDYVESDVIAVNGVETEDFDVDILKDTDSVVFKSGVVICMGKDDVSLTMHARKWLKSQREKVFVVTVSNEQHDALVALITANGGKVTK